MHDCSPAELIDVLIVGAGPAGLSAASALAQRGLQVGVVDPASAEALADPADDGREIALTPLSRDVLASLDQWSRLGSEEVTPMHEAWVFDGDDPQPMRVRGDANSEALGWMVSNRSLRRIAWQAARAHPGIRWMLQRRATGLQRLADHARVQLDDGSELRARLVIAADSRFSSLRRAAGLPARMHDFGRSMLVCRMRLQRPQPGVAWEWLGYGQTLALLPLQEDLASVVITLPPDDVSRLCSLSETDFAAEVEQRFQHRLGHMSLHGERHVYPLVGVHPERIAGPRFACLGDAAVGMHPITAHGYNLGLRGVRLLGLAIDQALSEGGDCGDLRYLGEYEHRLRSISRPLYLATQLVVQLYGDQRLPARLLRRAALRIGQHLPPFQALLRHTLGEREAIPSLPLRLLARGAAWLPRQRADAVPSRR